MEPLRAHTPKPRVKVEFDDGFTRDLDIHIGALIKRLRIKAGITQSALSRGTGVSLPQVQKYENATNRVSASRLYWFARTLNISPSYFFDSFISKNTPPMGLSDNAQESFDHEAMDNDTEKEELLKAYFSISDPAKRKWHLKHLKQDALSE